MRKVLPFWSQVRNYTAVASAFIYNLNIFGVSAKNICTPGFNCHGCPWATFSCPVGIIGYGFGVRSIPAFALGSVLAVGIVLGRLICGYACPFGMLQELLFRIKTPKLSMPKPLRYLKYIILLLTVFLLTYIFGFWADSAYIRVNKPVVAKDTPELDQGIFAAKNKGYFAKDKYKTTVTKGGFPVPEGLSAGEAGGGLKPIGLGAGGLAGDSADPFSLEEIADDTDIAQSSEEAFPAEEVGGLSPVGLGTGGLGDLLADESLNSSENSDTASTVSVFDQLEQKTEEKYKDSELLVEVTVDNLSALSLDEFVLTPVFFDKATGEEIWRGEDRVYNEHIPAGGSFTTEIFTVPYLLHKADIVILSPQTTVDMNYSTLFCTYCPVAAIEADIPSKLAGISDISQLIYATTRMNPLRLLITVILLGLSIFISRFFCRGFCPLGAMYGVVSRFAVVRIKLDKDKCIDCGKCDNVCPAELDVRKEVGRSECLSCGDCVHSCPTGALKRKVGL